MQMGDQHRLDHIEILGLLLHHTFNPGGERASHAIGQQHAEEGSHQRATNHRPQHRRRLVDVGHGFDHPQHSGDNPQRRQGVGHALQRVRGMHFLRHRLLQLASHQILDLVGIVAVHTEHPQIIANHVRHVMVLQNLRELLKRNAVLGLLDMRFQRHRALAAGQPHKEEQQAQQFNVVVLLVGTAFDHFAECPERMLHVVHRIGHQEGAHRRAANGP